MEKNYRKVTIRIIRIWGNGKKGYFELAEGGTIFLDEIGEIPSSLQAKLLRVLESRHFQKIGAQKNIYVGFRLLSATNKNLELMGEKGLFREDLYYRINMFDMVIPPLRERLANIPLLCQSITENLTGPERARQIRIMPELLAVLSAHPWGSMCASCAISSPMPFIR